MKIKLSEIITLSNSFLNRIGFSTDEASYTTNNLLEAQISGRESHGFQRLLWFKRLVEQKIIIPSIKDIKLVKETKVSIFVDGLLKPGAFVEYILFELALRKVRDAGIVIAGTTNTAPSHGFIGHYARVAAENDLIYLGFHNSDSLTIPFAASEPLWGTNPVTYGIPSMEFPIILDMASTKTTYGSIMLANTEGRTIEKELAVNKQGEYTIDPAEVIDNGGLLPFSGHKGSGSAFIVELLAGALTNSKVGNFKTGGWGGLFILINPELFRPIDEFKSDVTKAVRELKNARKMKGFKEIYYPGEQSLMKRNQTLKSGEIDIQDELYKKIID